MMNIRGFLNQQPEKEIFRLFSFLNKLLWDFLFPPTCFLCEKKLENIENFICIECQNSLPLVVNYKLTSTQYPRLLEESVEPFYDCIALYQYSQQIQQLIHLMKYQGFKVLASYFGRQFGTRFWDEDWRRECEVLIPVPLHKKRRHERGFNQSHIIACEIAKIFEIPCFDNVLVRTKYTQIQASLKKIERKNNVIDVFKVVDNSFIRNKTIGLVDDVCTTGSTMDECSKILYLAGAKKVYKMAIARAELKGLN